MEQLFADLLPHCDPQEEAALLTLHARLEAIYAAQGDLSAARNKLMALRSQTAQ